MINLPKYFELGASMSSMQTEGRGLTKIGKLAFDKYFELHPELFYNGIGPNITSDIMNHYKEDIGMFKDIGMDSVRTGFSWARLFPDGKSINVDAVEYYHNFLSEFNSNKIKIFMTLFHFDMPLWAQEKGAWSSKEVIDSFIKYCEFVFKEFVDQVDCFVTFNEPLVPVFGGYNGSSHYPAIDCPKEAIQQAYGIFLANSSVIKLYKEKKYTKPIGVVFDWNYTYPFSKSEEDIEASKLYDAYVNKGTLKIMYDGTIDPLIIKTLKDYNVVPMYTIEELEIIKNTKVDFLGINYYFPCRIKKKSNGLKRWALDEVTMEIPKDALMNEFRGWEIYPKSLYDISMGIKKEFDNIPWFISESGMGVENEDIFRNNDGIIEDTYRINYLNDHITQISMGIKDGTNCFGYHVWSAIDCWSFKNAYKNRYGLIEVDIKTQKRKYKKSALWYKEIISKKNKKYGK